MPPILIVGNPESYHIGSHFLAAARQLGLSAEIIDTREAWPGPQWLQRVFWHGLGKRPTGLHAFGARVIDQCKRNQPSVLLCTGIAPLTAGQLRTIGSMGIRRFNFLTDDPWNPKNMAIYFWKALGEYDVIFSPRKSNIEDLERSGCGSVRYLPFAYNPDIHFHEPPSTEGERLKYACDLAILGGCDEDRIPLALAARDAGLKIRLYGGYWERVKFLRPFCEGFVHDRELRLATAGATIQLCMGRRANRDGHAMRSFELPAMGACLLVEETEEHRDLFGEEGECVIYYGTTKDMVEKCRFLLNHPEECDRLRVAARKLIIEGHNTYKDRLEYIMRQTSD